MSPAIRDLCFADHKMAFLSGPRQCGKTTLAKLLLGEFDKGSYFLWDDPEFRRTWAKSPRQLLPSTTPALVVFDEIHKAKNWRSTLKGIFDTRQSPVDVLVTGSARLNLLRRSGDSLVGRYYHFHLHPFSLAELLGSAAPEPADFLQRIVTPHPAGRSKAAVETLEALMTYGGFPEPFLQQNERKCRLWRRTRIERVVREDLRDITRLWDLSQIEVLASLLPERAGSPLSRVALREILEVTYDTVRRWLGLLQDVYYSFELRPYTGSSSRSLRRETKLYLWDHGEVSNPAARFENLIAAHLLKLCDFWSDTGEGRFELRYLRTKDGREIDFLVLRDGKPFLPVEAKTTDTTPSPHWRWFLPRLGCKVGIQVTQIPDCWRTYEEEGRTLVVCDASSFLAWLA